MLLPILISSLIISSKTAQSRKIVMSIFFLSWIFEDHVVDRHSSCIPSSYYGYYCCVLGDQETKAFFQVENVIGFVVLLALLCSFPTLCQVGNVIGFVVLLRLLCSFPTFCQVENVIGFIVLRCCSFVLPQLYRT